MPVARKSKSPSKKPSRQTNASAGASGTERLLAAAIELIARDGFEGASVREIADHAGVSFALIRASYGSKEGLREAAEEKVFDEIFPLWVFAGQASSEEEVLSYMRTQAAAISRFTAHVAFLRRSILDQRPAANAFLKRVLTHLKKHGGYHLSTDYPNETWLFDPVRSMMMRIGYMLIAPNIKSVTGVDLMSSKEIERVNVEEARIWKLVELGLVQEKREKAKR